MKKLKLSAVLLIALVAIGCGLSNTMYNARAYFKSATERPLNSNGKPSPQAVDEYTKAIKKCGIIITEKKKGKTLEEALFIMAKALYLKGNSSFQAKDQFENLLRLNPTGRYVPEANIYLAKVLREINKPGEAKALLEAFIRDPGFKKDHPQVLLTLADFEIQDKDYYRAQYWLEKIIDEYPKTKLYPDAFFLFGKNYFVQKDYPRSLEEFSKLSKIRRIDKGLRLETMYYIALNHYELGNNAAGLRIIKDVIDDEVRTEKLALAKVLRGRFLLKGNEPDKGKAELEGVTKDYPRSQASGYAAWYLAEYQYYNLGDRAAALVSYAKVRTEYPTGEFVTDAQAKIAALTQLNSGARLNSETGLQQFLDYHYLAAENFFSQLNLPDSCFIMYRKVISEKDRLSLKADSLRTMESALVARIDSLSVLLSSAAVPEAKAETVIEGKTLADSLIAAADSTALTTGNPSPPNPESSFALADSTRQPVGNELAELSSGAVPDSLPGMADSLRIDTVSTLTDSTSVPGDSLVVDKGLDVAALQRQKSSAEAELTAMQSRIANLEKLVNRFTDEVIPFVNFAMASSYLKLERRDPEVADLLAYMVSEYPADKYTNAIRQLYNGDPVRVIDPESERLEKALDTALGEADSSPDSMLVRLRELSASSDPGIALRANFRLGWYYAIQQADTLSAKPYFEAVLKASDSGDYGVMTRNFFNGSKFIIYQKEQAKPDTTLPDSLQTLKTDSAEPAVTDSLSGFMQTAQDSLPAYNSSPGDSLNQAEKVPPGDQNKPGAIPDTVNGQEPLPQSPEPIINEEPEPAPDPDAPVEEAPLG